MKSWRGRQLGKISSSTPVTVSGICSNLTPLDEASVVLVDIMTQRLSPRYESWSSPWQGRMHLALEMSTLTRSYRPNLGLY